MDDFVVEDSQSQELVSDVNSIKNRVRGMGMV